MYWFGKDGHTFPADLYANQVLFYLQRLLPKHYNLVRFMANAEPLTQVALRSTTPDSRLKMAHDLNVTVWNPYTKHPTKAAPAPAAGELANANNKQGEVTLQLKGGELASYSQLSRGTQAPGLGAGPAAKPGTEKTPAKPKKPSPPPLGGRT